MYRPTTISGRLHGTEDGCVATGRRGSEIGVWGWSPAQNQIGGATPVRLPTDVEPWPPAPDQLQFPQQCSQLVGGGLPYQPVRVGDDSLGLAGAEVAK